MGCEEESKNLLFTEKQRFGGTGTGKEERALLSFSTFPPPPPQTHRCQTVFAGKKTSLQTHSDFWEAAQLHFLSYSPFASWERALEQFPAAPGMPG